MTISEETLKKVYEYILESGYKYASDLYINGFNWILEETTPTKEDVYENFDECAQHEGIQFYIFEDEESKHLKYLDLIDHDDIKYYFYVGGHRLIDENFRET